MIGFFDLVDFWVRDKKAYDSLHVVHRDQVNRARNADTQRERAKRLFYSQDYMIVKHGKHIFEKFTKCAKVCGLFS